MYIYILYLYTVRRYTYVYVAHLYLLSILYPNTRLVRAWGGAGWPCAQFTIWRNMAWVAHEKTRSLCTKHVFPPSVFHTSMENWIFNPQTISPISINPVILGHTKAPLLMERGNIIKHLFNVERKLPFSTPRFCGSFWWKNSILCSTVSPLPFFPSKIRMEKRPIWEFFDWHLAAYTGEAFLGIPWKQHRTCIIQSWRHRKKDERSC